MHNYNVHVFITITAKVVYLGARIDLGPRPSRNTEGNGGQ